MDTNSAPQETPEVVPAPEVKAPEVDDSCSIAESYVASELVRARSTLRNTQLIGAGVLVVLIAYLGYVTVTFKQSFEPKAAAEIANGIIAGHVTAQANDLAEQFKTQVPMIIEHLPDTALEQIKPFRENFEEQFEKDLTAECDSSAKLVQDNLENYLTEHQDEMKGALTAGGDPAAVHEMGLHLEDAFMKSLQERPAGGGESVKEKIDKSLALLQQISSKVDRLANGKNLTAQEKKTRRAIAVLTTVVNHNIEKAGVKPVKIATTKIDG